MTDIVATTHAAGKSSTGRLATASSVGTTLEWYDFTVYNTLAALIFLYALVFVFTLTYVTTVLSLSRTVALTAIMIATPINAVMIPLFGALSDRAGRRPVYGAGAVLAMVWAFGFFVLMDTAQAELIVLAVVIGGVIHASMFGPQAAFVIEQFPTRVRYAGSSLAYTLAGIVGGGFAPLIIASLFRAYHTTTAISLYVVGSLAVTSLALLVARETGPSPLEE